MVGYGWMLGYELCIWTYRIYSIALSAHMCAPNTCTIGKNLFFIFCVKHLYVVFVVVDVELQKPKTKWNETTDWHQCCPLIWTNDDIMWELSMFNGNCTCDTTRATTTTTIQHCQRLTWKIHVKEFAILFGYKFHFNGSITLKRNEKNGDMLWMPSSSIYWKRSTELFCIFSILYGFSVTIMRGPWLIHFALE